MCYVPGTETAAATFLGMTAKTWATVGTVASTAMSAYNAYQGAQSQNDMAKYNAAVARNNAQMAEYQAQDAISRGNKAAEDHSRKVASLAGTQRASMAARGLDLSDGTPVDILTDTDLLGQYDINTIKDNAAKEAWGARVQAGNYRSSADQYDSSSRGSSPLFAAGGSLLGGAASLADKWYRNTKVA